MPTKPGEPQKIVFAPKTNPFQPRGTGVFSAAGVEMSPAALEGAFRDIKKSIAAQHSWAPKKTVLDTSWTSSRPATTALARPEPRQATVELIALRAELAELRKTLSQLAANQLLTAAATPLLPAPGAPSTLPATQALVPVAVPEPVAPVVLRNVNRTVLHGPNNTSVPIAATEETTLVHPDGSREYQMTNHRYRDDAGRQLNLEDQILACPYCARKTLTPASMRTCTQCQQPACIWCTTVTENEEHDRSYFCPTHAPRTGGFFETILGIAAFLLS